MILFIAENNDPTVNFIEDRVKERKISSLRINVEIFPREKIKFHVLGGNNSDTLILGGKEVTTSLVSGIFSRFITEISVLNLATIPVQFKQFASKEIKDLLFFLLFSCQNSRWVNSPQSSMVASVKLFQLCIAKSSGLSIPETLVSSCNEDLIQFWNGKSGKVVTKAVHRGLISTGKDKVTHTVVFTNVVKKAQLDQLTNSNFPPILFQEKLQKEAELRIVVMGKKCFTCRLGGTTHVDWRKDPTVTENSTPYQLPEDIEQKCIRLVNFMGLSFGVIDMILTPEGEHVFLEVNPQGEWLWMEQLLDYPIRDALIDYLINST